MEHLFAPPQAGVDLITQEYLAARREVRARDDLTSTQREILKEELAEEQ